MLRRRFPKLREVVVKWVRAMGLKVLLCPDMSYAVNIINPLLFDLLLVIASANGVSCSICATRPTHGKGRCGATSD
jgi:hypothetical protein